MVTRAAQRIARRNYPAWEAAAKAAGWCVTPVRLAGSVSRVHPDTGEIAWSFTTRHQPDGVLLKACQSRRATRCPACAAVYHSDARALITAGLVGGKGMPSAVGERPVVFATLTAPSFGAVHTCHPDHSPCHRFGPSGQRCGHRHRCEHVHSPGDPVVGTPLCADCYDWEGTVVWNARAGELWRRTIIATRRALAGHAGMTVKAFEAHQVLAYVKIIEYQARGVVHIHALLRLDPAREGRTLDAGVLAAALRHAVARVTAPNPAQRARPIRWGIQNHLEAIPPGERAAVAGYLAKYTTKSVDAGGILDRRLRSGELDGLPAPDHLRRLAQTAWTLADYPRLGELNLRAWAHTLGYRGHWLTKSRTWSTTLTQLRSDRHHWQLVAHGHNPESDPTVAVGDWDYQGNGHTTAADTWLAHQGAARRKRDRRTAWEERP